MKTRIYAVTDAKGFVRMIEAANPSQAMRHVAEDTFRVSIAAALDVAQYMRHGRSVEFATEPAGDPE